MPRLTNPANNPDPRKPSSDTDVRANVLAAVTAAVYKLTPLDLQRQIAEKYLHNRRQIQSAIRRLVSEGELNYINHSGRTLVELSFNRPVQISKRIILSPAGRSIQGDDRAAVVFLQPGVAFGDGRHPSTRLALAGIDEMRDHLISRQNEVDAAVLDIGTGSGVLVVAAIRLGFDCGIGLDIDPCALSEARENVALNRLTSRIEVSDRPLESLKGRFRLICANLRWPTLRILCGQIKALLEPEGAVVIAGIKANETPALIDWYAQAGFNCSWERSQQDWAAVVLRLAN